MQTLTLQSPYDMHIHLRDGDMLQKVAKYTSKSFSGAVVMPNLNPPITTTAAALSYQTRILTHTQDFMPILTLYLTQELTKEELKKAKQAGIFILKLYPKGSTTGSEHGISQILNPALLAILEHAQELGFFLSIHGESNGFVLDREVEFHPVFEYLAKNFPKLPIIFEHLSHRDSIKLIEKYPNLYGTLTLHHLILSLDEVIGGMLNAHHFCKPIIKTKKDQQALLQAALCAHEKISFGSDSAPHPKEQKEQKGAAGIFSAPIVLPYLAEIFEEHNALENLEAFVSTNAQKIYHLPKTKKTITLQKKPSQIQQHYEGIIPLMAGKMLSWSLA